MYRTYKCGELRREDAGKTVKLAGWIDTVRDHGGVTFVDLRDQTGIIQVVIGEETSENLPPRESVIAVEGRVVPRSQEAVNKKLETGEIEVKADGIEILSKCVNVLPFEIAESHNTKEDLRLKYRFLDLRNPSVRKNIELRAEVISFLRFQMKELGFTEVQTPILTASSPEGARDYLVPSRKFKGKFYALPQAPQQFKQLLIAGGIDKYFQIAPCFRDEDARADRSPGEFYQLDFEMAFATQEDVFLVTEQVLYNTFKKFTCKKINKPPFSRIPYEESMLKYGTDKPDLRNPLVIHDLTELFKDSDFTAFKGKPVRSIKVNSKDINRTFLDKMTEFAASIGMKGLGYITRNENEFKGPITKFLSSENLENLDLKKGDVLFFISDHPKIVNKFAGQIRAELANRLKLIDENRFEMCFIVDFPMYEKNEETGLIDFTHNPFSMPQGELDALLNKNPLEIKAYQYDIVCNGIELSSGAVRNHRPDIMEKAFEIAGYTKEDLTSKFSALFNAFRYGVPPHAGAAPGIDRMIMLLTDCENVREVIAFPMNSNAQDILLNAPSEVTEKQLREVHIKLR
jgi:aspartyl-tRNA synthetase